VIQTRIKYRHIQRSSVAIFPQRFVVEIREAAAQDQVVIVVGIGSCCSVGAVCENTLKASGAEGVVGVPAARGCDVVGRGGAGRFSGYQVPSVITRPSAKRR
jgi:hypothetical protein